MRLWRHRHRGWPRNPTAGTPGYDATKWVYVCDKCGRRESVPLERVIHSDGDVAIGPPEGWR